MQWNYQNHKKKSFLPCLSNTRSILPNKMSRDQAWILALVIEQCSARNRVMSDESCFTTDTIVSCEVNFFFISCRRFKTHKHLVSIDFSCSGFFYGHFNRQFTYAVFFIFRFISCVLVKRCYTNILFCFFSASLLKTFYLSFHSPKNLKNI